ncbi:preprotein translocase subunit YajC [Desulfovibrio subterraneus]|jgi:preprotein translocase subunit YajC|uniref:Sec translocon accessory complex subunit YajC n=1 Tax=Desulfovibrio subterraneus TaxID=2718620 RepID=A0A7J0BKS7_9BACT|nr:preprotein translocase subunit YajC [Desulfovibrio subterraneus]WBF67943.1 preprotein translocase subunit YajC [Desulfovibrio subterraneus]GFM33812.1 preprotein translocase subunit YajC [Desulfovibrio subterraneus]
MSFINTAWAMGNVGQASGQGGGIAAFAPLILMFAIFYFLLIRPQQKKAKEHKAMLEGLKKGDAVVTAGGLYGTVVEAKEEVLTVDLGTTTVKVGRQFVSGLVSAPAPKEKKKGKEEKQAEKQENK